jgi:serine phosphatase RsbU (regulator of sigma subunit)
MSATRAYLRALMLINSRVGDIMSVLNRALAADVDDGCFVTMVLARLDPGSRSFVYSSAGHNEGFVLTPSGEVRTVIRSTALPLGITADSEFPEAPAITLEPGELVLLLTDGVLEARSPDQKLFGNERALDVVRANRSRPAGAIVEALYQAVCAFSRDNAILDDVTCLVIKVGEMRRR